MTGSDIRLTMLYDAFGRKTPMIKDWGFATFIHYQGLNILFDSGNNADIFAHNVEVAGIDLNALDFTVISHRHGDHTTGLNHLLRVNPDVTIYTPQEMFGVFGSSLPGTCYRCDCSLPNHMRYFDGCAPDVIPTGTPWEKANFSWLDSTTELAPGVHVVSTVSDVPGTLEMRELSLGLETPEGLVLIVGCSHPGIENIVKAATEISPEIYSVLGGMHLLNTPDDEISRISESLLNTYHVNQIAPAHCTGEPAFAEFQRAFADQYTYAGLGTVLTFPG